MSDITTLLREQTAVEPPYDVDVDRLIAGGRRARTRRGAVVLTSCAVLVGVLTVPFALRQSASDPGGSVVTPADDPSPSPAPSPSRRDDSPITKDNLAPAIAELVAPSTLVEPQDVIEGQPLAPRALNFLGNVDDGGGRGSLFVSIHGPRMLTTPPTSCAVINTRGSMDGDGYVGPCRVEVLPDGSTLQFRSGHTATGGFAKSAAVLVRPDGSGVTAEATNQPYIGPPAIYHPSEVPSPPPASRELPALTAEQLRDLVLELARRGRG